MPEYYDPMLFMSTPDHPNTMGVVVVLKEPVDGELLSSVVGELRERFPYYYVRARAVGNDLELIPNPLPMTVRKSWEPINFNSQASNYHLAAWKYEGTRIAFEIAHSLTDGAGVLPYIKSAMYLYLTRKTGERLDPTGFRLPGDRIPQSETGNPFTEVQAEIDRAEAPLYVKETTADFFRLNDGPRDPQMIYLKLPESQVMKFCHENDGSPNVFFSVLLARAARRADPENEKTISVAVAIDHKAMLGNTDNYRNCVNVIELDFPRNRPLDDIMKACTMARGQVMLQAQRENSLWEMKQREMRHSKLAQMPLEMKLGVAAKSAGSVRWSLSVSYANSRTFGPLDPYIAELYVLSEAGVIDAILEIACINHCFFLAVDQTFSSDHFMNLFLDELSQNGIDAEVMGREPARLCGIEPYAV